MTPSQRIQAIADRAERATAAPWEASTDNPGDVVIWGPKEDWLANVGNWARQRDPADMDAESSARQFVEMRDAADAAFIAAAREDVPWLLQEVERLREALRAVRKVARVLQINRVRHEIGCVFKSKAECGCGALQANLGVDRILYDANTTPEDA